MISDGNVLTTEDVSLLTGFVMVMPTVLTYLMRTLYIVLLGRVALVGGNVNKACPACI